MIILQSQQTIKGREDAFRAMGRTLSPLLGKRNVIFAENAPNLSGLTEHAQPVYIRA